uniref:Uncharacterized protein n=1 Tax=Panagrolaimus sp. PS1159 TaxID=55785 RepID=A0AC35GS95_9BILA
MIGTIIVNNSNEIIQSFGNKEFCNHLKTLVCDSQSAPKTQQRFSSSSSSGISSCESTLNKENRNSLLRSIDSTTNFSKTKVDDEILLSLVLPLFAMYQSRKDTDNNEITLLYSNDLKFSFQKYDISHFIIVISSNNYSEAEIEEFSKSVKSLLNFYYGPFIYFIKADLSSVKRKRGKVEKNMELLISQLENGNLKYPMLNVNALYLNCNKYKTFMPHFRKLIGEITNVIGHCRCIFVSSGQIIASVCSKTKRPVSIIDLVDPSDINNLVQMCQIFDQSSTTTNLISSSSNNINNENVSSFSSKKRLQHHFEQIWVHFPNSPKQTRQFVNAFLFSLSSEIDLICLNSIDQSTPIHITCDLLDLLEDIENFEEDKTIYVAKTGELIQELAQILGTFKPKYCNKDAPYMFLENIQRTNILLKNLWSRLHIELLRPLGNSKNNDDKKQRSFSTLFSSYSPYSTINRWSSTVSLFSTSSQRSNSTNNFGGIHQKPKLPIQTLAMIKHFQRQLRLLLNEFCIHSYSIGKFEKFKLAENAMQKVMDRCMSQNLQPLFSKSAKELHNKSEIAPAKLGFDMIGYVFYGLDAPFNIFSYPSQYGKAFLNLYSKEAALSDIFIGRLETGELLIHFTGTLSTPLSNSKNSSNTKKDILDFPISCAAVFPSLINSQLAIRQTFSLASVLNQKIKIITSMFE